MRWREDAGDDVGAAAGAERTDYADGLGRVVLRRRRRGDPGRQKPSGGHRPHRRFMSFPPGSVCFAAILRTNRRRWNSTVCTRRKRLLPSFRRTAATRCGGGWLDRTGGVCGRDRSRRTVDFVFRGRPAGVERADADVEDLGGREFAHELGHLRIIFNDHRAGAGHESRVGFMAWVLIEPIAKERVSFAAHFAGNLKLITGLLMKQDSCMKESSAGKARRRSRPLR